MKKKPDYKWAAKELAKMADEEKDPYLKMLFGRAAAIGRDKAQKQIDATQPLEHTPEKL